MEANILGTNIKTVIPRTQRGSSGMDRHTRTQNTSIYTCINTIYNCSPIIFDVFSFGHPECMRILV